MRRIKSFSELKSIYVPNYKVLTIRPVKRPYINQTDVVYDYYVGHEFAVTDKLSPFSGCVITVLDRETLQRHGYTHAMIHYNIADDAKVEVRL